jgi:hypothetical protein
VTYALTTGGDNAGIVSEARHPGRSYQIATKRATDKYEDLDTWLNKCLEGRRFLVPGVGAMAGRGLATILIVVFALMAVDESGPLAPTTPALQRETWRLGIRSYLAN